MRNCIFMCSEELDVSFVNTHTHKNKTYKRNTHLLMNNITDLSIKVSLRGASGTASSAALVAFGVVSCAAHVTLDAASSNIFVGAGSTEAPSISSAITFDVNSSSGKIELISGST